MPLKTPVIETAAGVRKFLGYMMREGGNTF